MLLAAAALAAPPHAERVPTPVRAAVTDTVPALSRQDLERLFGAAEPDEATLPADTARAALLLPFRRGPLTASLREPRRPLTPPLGPYWTRHVEFDPETGRYTVREHAGGGDVRVPVTLSLDAYREVRRRFALDDGFRDLARTRATARRGRGGLGLGFEIPGGAGRGLRTVFGSDQVDLRVNGQANVNAGFDHRRSAQQQLATGRSGQTDPTFGQELGLSIVGTIGDKLEVNVNFDTQTEFDFQNQVRLVYTGYEDEIVRRIEAGNVFLPVESDLIRGGQRLFGLKTDLQFGGLSLTAVASQQDAESDELVITGGTRTTPFSLLPTQYEDATHLLLGFHFYNRWDAAHAAPPSPVLGRVKRILDVEVYKFDTRLTAPSVGDDVVAGVALVDLGEPAAVLRGGRAYLAEAGENPPAPGPEVDRYPEAALEALRAGGFTSALAARNRLASQGVDVSVLRESDLVVSRFRRLRPGLDYDVDRTFGYVSLRQRLAESDVIAVAYTYEREDGQVVAVGDIGRGTGAGNVDEGPRLVLKLLRPANVQPTDAAWDLTLRNIYAVGGRGLDPEGFELQILYGGPGQTPQRTLPGVTVGQGQTLLQTLGLDRLNRDGRPVPDDLFDFLPGFTVHPGSGRIVFPYREPFGARLREVLTSSEVRLDGLTPEQAVERYVFDLLYTEKPEVAARQTDRNVFRIAGSTRTAAQEVYDLGGFAVVEGSVQVRAGELLLREGVDYIVDYAAGTVTITNPAFLAPGRDVRIAFERQQFVQLQRKTLLGLRGVYAFSDRFTVGGTWMRLAERPIADKYRVGEEPVANAIWGLDARYEAEPTWITRALDALPFLQTRAPSHFEFRGEFAQLLPGHPQSFAFDRSRAALLGDGRDLTPDELEGVSFIDDFEGSQNALSLLRPEGWRLASGPTSPPGHPTAGPPGAVTYLEDLPGPPCLTDVRCVTRPELRSNWRGLFAWYAVFPALYDGRALAGVPLNAATRPVRVEEVFPQRELRRGETGLLTPLDVYFDPHRRGPYNYNAELGSTYTARPRQVWGGMMQRIPDGYRDFEARNNVEYIELIVAAFGGRHADEPVSPEAMLFVDLGRVSEDVLPDGELNQEDGLLQTASVGPWGRRGGGITDGVVNVNTETRRTEDLGFDGLPSGALCRIAAENGTPYDLCEEEHFAPFLETLRTTMAPDDPRLLRALGDPSADQFRHFRDTAYFEDPTLWPGGATLQERFSQYYAGLEGNALETQALLTGRGDGGLTRLPDSEDLNLDGSLNTTEAFFRYAVPLEPGRLRASPFFVEEVATTTDATWVLLRIPVRSEHRVAVGGIEGFRDVEAIRVWTTGHDRPVTLRFAKFDLVGSQWVKAPQAAAARPDRPVPAEPEVFVAAVNNEENPTSYLIPNGTIRSFTRDATSGALLQNREQALALRVSGLVPGAGAAVFRPFTRGLDLTRYRHLRLFVHGSGFERADSLRVFVRLGANETEDYYEIEQPLYPWSPPPGQTVADVARAIGTAAAADSLWQTNVRVPGRGTIDLNAINVPFAALNVLKVERDLRLGEDGLPIPTTEVYERPASAFAEALGDFAPPGAVLRIRGNPSIQNVTAIAMGVRRPETARAGAADADVWFNELRVTGYDERAGWSAYARTTLRLADVADLNARYARQTDGFGDLTSTLGNRAFQNQEGFRFTGNLQLHRFLPERHGWQIPVTVSLDRQTATPRFSPGRGDITVEQELAQVQADPTLGPEEREAALEAVRRAAETFAFTRTVRIPISKTGSRSPLLRYTLDGMQLTYTASATERRSPQRALEDATQWSATLAYRLAPPRPLLVRPLWFLGETPVLGGLRLNLLPQQVRFTADATRSIVENQDRAPRMLSRDPLRQPLERAALDDPTVGSFLYPINRRHAFGHTRSLELQHTPLANLLTLSYGSRLRQSLDAAGADGAFRLLVQDVDRPGTFAVFEDRAFEELFAVERDAQGRVTTLGPGFAALGIGPEDPRLDAPPATFLRTYPVTSLRVRPAPTVLGDVLSGERDVLTDTFTQQFSATLSSPIDRVRALSWLRLAPLTYASTFTWGFVPLARIEDAPTVATLSTDATLRGGLSLRLRDLAQRVGPWRRAFEAQQAADQARQRERQVYEARLRAYRQARERVREAEAALRAAEAEAEATGRPVPESLRERLRQAQAADTLAAPQPPSPLPNPLDLVRRTLLAASAPRDLSITYDASFGSRIGNAREPGFGLLSALTGDGPPLGFRLGLDRTFPADPEARFFGTPAFPLSFSDDFRDTHRLSARTALEPSPSLRIDLTWSMSLSEQETRSYARDELGRVTSIPARGGRGEATVVALGGSYRALFERHLARLREADFGAPTVTTEALTNNAVAEDFRAAFTTSLGRVGRQGFFALPLPNWQASWTGLTDWPLFRSLAQSATLRHGYAATYEADFRSFLTPPGTRALTLQGEGGLRETFSLAPPRPDTLRLEAARVTQRLQPLLGLDLNLRGGVQTSIVWNSSVTHALSAANAYVNQSATEELALRMSLARTGFRLPLPGAPQRLSNQLRMSLVVARARNLQRRYALREDLQAQLAAERLGRPLPETFLAPPAEASTRTSIEPQLSYTLSSQVVASVFLRYERFEAENSRIPTTTNLNGGFNFRISFSN